MNKVVSERLKRNVVKPADKKRIDFISKHEGFTLKAEEIKIGKGKTDKTLTVGGGITAKVYKELTGKTLKKGDSITKEESTRVTKLFIEKEIDPELDKINKSFQLNENQKIALSSLLFNIGVGDLWKGSNARKALIKGDIAEFIKQAFSKEEGFVKSNGIVVDGLVKRRKDEKELFLKKGK